MVNPIAKSSTLYPILYNVMGMIARYNVMGYTNIVIGYNGIEKGYIYIYICIYI